MISSFCFTFTTSYYTYYNLFLNYSATLLLFILIYRVFNSFLLRFVLFLLFFGNIFLKRFDFFYFRNTQSAAVLMNFLMWKRAESSRGYTRTTLLPNYARNRASILNALYICIYSVSCRRTAVLRNRTHVQKEYNFISFRFCL